MIKLSIFLFFCLFFVSLWGDDFDDLTEGEEPLYGSKKRERYRSTALFWEIEDWEGHYSETIFFLYKYINYPKYTANRFFPFYSKIQSKIDSRKYSRFLNYTVKEKDREFEKSFLPILYWGENSKNMQTYFTFFPFFYTETQTLQTKTSYKFLSPLFYYSNKAETNEKQNYSLSSEFILPIYRKSYEKTENFEKVSYSLPALPLLYYTKENQNKFFTLAWIFGLEWTEASSFKSYLVPAWYYSSNSQEQSSFFISPIFYKDKTSYYEYKSYFYLLYTWEHGSKGWNFLGLASSSLDEQNLRKNYLFPFWYYKENEMFLSPIYSKVQAPNETFYFGPLYYFRNSLSEHTTWILNFYRTSNSDSAYTHVFPIFEYEYNTDEKYFSLFYIINKQTKKNESKLNLFPLYFYEENSDGIKYSFFFGLYGLSYNSKREFEKAKFLPFWYYQKNEVLFTPLYMSFQEKEGRSGKTFSLFYNRVWSEETEFKNILLYVNLQDQKRVNFFTALVPFWWDWKSQTTTGNIFLPFYGKYKNKQGEEWSLNILGIAQSTKTGVLRPDLNVGRKGNRFYLDTDFSWFYSLFRFSTRVSAQNPFLNYTEENLVSESLEETPSLSEKRSFTRENTNFFYGYSALFYAIAYEKGDSKRHFRVFPFMWFTWNEENEDQLILFPPILPLVFYYNTSELKYMAFIPFYGKQMTPEAKIQAVLFTAYIKEEYTENNLQETSILWPIVNLYTSNEESGLRIFPIFWNKQTQKEASFYFRNFSPLHYYSNYKDNSISLEENKFFSFLFYFENQETQDKKEKKYFFPIYYYSEYIFKSSENKRNEERSFSWSLLHYKQKEKTKFGEVSLETETFISPFFIQGKQNENAKTYLYTFYPPLLFYTEELPEEKYYNFALMGNFSKKENFTSLGFGFIVNLIGIESRNDKKLLDSKYWILPIVYRYKEEFKQDAENTSSLSSLNYFFPFIFHFQKDLYTNEKLKESYSSLLTLFYFRETKQLEQNETEKTEFYTIPFLYKTENKNFFSMRLWIFISYNKDYSNKEFEFNIWPLYPIIYYDSQTKHFNLLGLLFDSKKTLDYERIYLFPVWYSVTQYTFGAEEKLSYYETKYFHIFPIYFSEKKTSSASGSEFNFFSLGLYYERQKESLYWNYLFLLDYESKKAEATKLGFLFHSFYYESSQEHTNTSIFYDFIWSSRKQKDFTKYTFLFNKYEKSQEFLDITFFPLFSYENRKNTIDFFFYPSLSSYEKEEHKQKLYHLLGILYYSEQNFFLKENKHNSLLGLAYSYHEYQNPSGFIKELDIFPFGLLYSSSRKGESSEDLKLGWGSIFLYERKQENEYHRFGSLWGWLWQYEYEDKTDYRKFSILKLFSYEVYKGTTRILGIPIH